MLNLDLGVYHPKDFVWSAPNFWISEPTSLPFLLHPKTQSYPVRTYRLTAKLTTGSGRADGCLSEMFGNSSQSVNIMM